MQYSGDFQKMINKYNEELKKLSRKSKPQPAKTTNAKAETIKTQAQPQDEQQPVETTTRSTFLKDYLLPNIQESQMIEGQTENLTGSGKLLVRVFSAKQAAPIIDALVSVSFRNSGGEELIKSAFTNQDGEVPTYTLPTVNKQESLEPGVKNPYASYRVVVSSEGFFTMDSVNVPIFDGETAVLPVEMLPIPEFYNGNTILRAFDTGAIDLN
ncbi:MAG: carboxypeptidase regulatory-like domain-containing protein [Clostridia bacterium]|nr:carboxypeptidase regulatory-like domain-containing protein [Clostridia bacterium]